MPQGGVGVSASVTIARASNVAHPALIAAPPDLKPFVERAIRSVKQECLYAQHPATVEQADPLGRQRQSEPTSLSPGGREDRLPRQTVEDLRQVVAGDFERGRD